MTKIITEFKDVDNLSSGDFEIFVRDVFVAAGWSDAVITKVGKEFKHGDGGVDIFAYKRSRKFAIEVKQRQITTTVDVKALNQLVTGAKLANTQNMILVTNSYFTSEVKIRALRLGVELLDRDELQNLWIKKLSEIGRDIRPRKYQQDVINKSLELYGNGKSRLLIEMATGLGKTYTVAYLIKNILQGERRKFRVLFIAHQVEILLQSVTAFKNVLGIGDYSFSACFSGSDPEETDFVFASFDTLYTKIHELKSNVYDVVVIDEAHHTPARTYSNVVEFFKPKLLLGLTATPYRSDNKDVMKYFGGSEGHVGKYDLAWALKHNKLAFPKYMVMLDDLDQGRLNQLEAGVSISDLDKKLFLHKKDEEVVKLISKTINEKNIKNPKGIVFCRSIAHIKHLIKFFDIGSATMVHSKMLDQERRENIRKFRETSLKFILVCDLFNEGIDIPETNLLVFMRYTGSRTIWLQQLGRGLRKTPNKDYVHVLDFVGSLERLNEIRILKDSIKKIKINKEDWEKPPKEESQSIIHDSTLDVNYNQSAANVLKLIEELKYKLNSREIMIDILRVYAEENNRVPEITEFEKVIGEVSCDQVSTHFDSYFRYLMFSVPSYINEKNFKKRIKKFIAEYKSQHKILPSKRAVSLGFKFKSLMEFTEQDILDLVGEIDNRENIRLGELNVSDEPKDIFGAKNEEGNIENGLSEQKKYLIEKYKGRVNSANDIKTLSESEQEEIKINFKSIFYFVRLLKEW